MIARTLGDLARKPPRPGQVTTHRPIRGRPAVCAALGAILVGLAATGGPGSAGDPVRAAAAPPGAPASAHTVHELQATLAQAVTRFEAKDASGVLAHISEQYRTGPFTKAGVRAQLLAIFQIYERVSARIRIDEVRLVDGHAWVYSTGEISGRLPLIGGWLPLFTWEREVEVARREGPAWRLFGYQQ